MIVVSLKRLLHVVPCVMTYEIQFYWLNKGGSFHTNFLNYLRFTKTFFNIQEHFEFSQLEGNYLGEKCLPEVQFILHCHNIYIIISAPINDRIFFRCYLKKYGRARNHNKGVLQMLATSVVCQNMI